MTGVKRSMMAAAGAGGDKTYVEDVFSTYVFTANGQTGQTITNGIDLSGEGGMVWHKDRQATYGHVVWDTARGDSLILSTDAAGVDTTKTMTGDGTGQIAFKANGYDLKWDTGNEGTNRTVGWTFRKAEKFFDIVTWTGNSVTGREIPHNLGSVPGMIIIKRRDAARSWIVYHRSMGNGHIIKLDTSAAKESSALFNSTTPTSTVFEVNNDHDVNYTDGTYVAYLFAHNEESFGAGGNESIIKCGSFSTSSSPASVDLGWEPQWLLVKNSTTGASWDNWWMVDNMRGVYTDLSNYRLRADTTAIESEFGDAINFRATGFDFADSASETYIYMAIRRPMKVPETATDVFAVATRTTGKPNWISNFVVDAAWQNPNIGAARHEDVFSRLTGKYFIPAGSNDAESAGGTDFDHWDSMTGWRKDGSTVSTAISWMWRRAPEFMDVVCYTGNDASDRAVTHGLGVTPDMYIVKSRSRAQDWRIWHKDLSGNDYSFRLDNDSAEYQLANGIFGGNAPTSTSFYVDDTGNTMITNHGSDKYICYLYATLAGISKVGSYTADGTLTTIDCGFSAGARFVLIKRINASGNWYLYDSVRGIVAGNDPYLTVNTETAQTTGTDYIDPVSSGFSITAAGSSTINVDTGKYIFLAFA